MKTNYKFIWLLFFCCIAYSVPVYSQEDTAKYQTEEIIVTGTRVEQKIIDIPFSVQRIDQSSWVASRKVGVNDVLTTVPGLFLQSRYGNHDVRVTLRGYGSRSNSGIRGIRILLDGIPESEPDGQTRIEALDFTAIGKIELVKGNSSSLYTNAPGGVINFFTDKYFLNTFALSDNEFGSFDLRKNGIKVGVNSKNTRFMITGSYENYKGYRTHSQQYQTRLNSIYEADITPKSKLSFYGYYVNGLIKLPGSLTLSEYQTNDTMANPASISRDEKRITKKGRLGISYYSSFGKKDNNIVEVTGYGTIKDLERTSSGSGRYRIFNRWGVGSSFRYINKTDFYGRMNEFSLGGDLYYQTGPISAFDNIAGQKGDDLKSLASETISNVGFYALEQFPLIKDRLSILVTGRYDRINFSSQDLRASFKDTSRLFAKVTPKVALNLKLSKNTSVYASVGLSFDSPAFNEMDNYAFTSDEGLHLLNPDLQAQKSRHIEAGFKGSFSSYRKKYFNNTFVEAAIYNSRIEDAIVPFAIGTDVFFKNAALVKRTGIEFGLNSEVIKGLTLKGAYTFQDFKYNEYKTITITGEGDTTHNDFSGNIEPANPKNLFTGEIMYQYTFKKKYTLFAKSYIQYVGEMFGDDANSDTSKTESYSLINGQIGADLYIGNFRLLAYAGINNIADKKYVSFININDINGKYFESGAPRNFFGGLTLAYLFKK